MDRQRELEGLVKVIQGLLHMHNAYLDVDFSEAYVGDVICKGFEEYAPEISFTE